jgi:hypothetical protein
MFFLARRLPPINIAGTEKLDESEKTKGSDETGEVKNARDCLHVKVENSGLFWHLTGVIRVFLFPLLYLIT